MKTIKQLADEIGISKQALNKRIDNLGCRNQLSKNGNTWLIPESVEKRLKENKIDNHRQPTNNQPVDTLVDTLLKQLEEKDKQIETLMRTLDQAQQLQALAETKLKAIEDKQQPKKTFWFKRKKHSD